MNAYDIILKPVMSEKAYDGIHKKIYTFKVARNANKIEIKQAVEQNICNHIIASDTDIDAATYQKMRGMSYQEVLRTNGQISFPEVLRQQNRL